MKILAVFFVGVALTCAGASAKHGRKHHKNIGTSTASNNGTGEFGPNLSQDPTDIIPGVSDGMDGGQIFNGHGDGDGSPSSSSPGGSGSQGHEGGMRKVSKKLRANLYDAWNNSHFRLH